MTLDVILSAPPPMWAYLCPSPCVAAYPLCGHTCAGQNPCAVNNGGCKYLCLLKEGGGGYGCACPTGVLLAKDGHSCQDINTFVLFTHRIGIRRLSLDTSELISVPLPVYNLSVAGGLAWDLPSNSLFWADRSKIYVANLNGSNQRPLIMDNLRSVMNMY
eukprot:Em0105g7a